MAARLVAIAGPLEGAAFEIADRVTVAHCRITRSGGRYGLRNLDDQLAIAVNGLPARDRQLEDGDRIGVGDTLFLFVSGIDAGSASPSAAIDADAGRLSIRSEVRLTREQAFGAEEDAPQESPGGRADRDLRALQRISAALSGIHGLAALPRPLLALLFDAIPADRGAIIFVGSSNGNAESAFGMHRNAGARGPVRISRSIVDRVIRDRVAILVELARGDAAATRRSILAAPMAMFDRAIGVVYLESSSRSDPFDRDHLRLLDAVGGIAALAVDHAREVADLESENRRLQAHADIDHNMIGQSAPMRRLYDLIARVSRTDSTVLISGESGTGKELVARAIHRNSRRAAKPFGAINCAAITDTLLESELFGYEKGAFTGAASQKRGKLEVADGGTVFLDEIGELPLPLQTKLLRVLQEREFERVGGTAPMRIDVRVVAATNRDLTAAINAGTFRQDLYYRLNVVGLQLPPKRERREDIVPLARHFAAKHGLKRNQHPFSISPDAEALLVGCDWPGNVRELENTIERAIVLGTSNVIGPADLTQGTREPDRPPRASYHDAIRELKKTLIVGAIERARGNHGEAARLLSVHPNYLHRLIRNLDLKKTVRSLKVEV